MKWLFRRMVPAAGDRTRSIETPPERLDYANNLFASESSRSSDPTLAAANASPAETLRSRAREARASSIGEGSRLRLFQFWHADPPEDIAGFMDAARTGQADFDYVSLDEQTGRAFVGEHYGARALAVWDACALPVMWSDFLRLLLMDTYGGVYTDASYEFRGDLSKVVADVLVGQIPVWFHVVNGNYMMFRKPGNAYIRACIALLMDNVEHRRFDSSLMAVGPGVLNSVRCVASPEQRPGIMSQCDGVDDWVRWGWRESVAVADRLIEPTEELKADYRAIALIPLEELDLQARSNQFASHRNRDDHWYKWKGSIYR